MTADRKSDPRGKGWRLIAPLTSREAHAWLIAIVVAIVLMAFLLL